MNDMPWLDGLTEQQMHLASMIVHKAKKEGVDPKLALALAFRESNLKHGNFDKNEKGDIVFKPLTGTSGEVGVMQVTPDAAKFHGFKPEELNNLEKNMEIGLKVLKSHLGKFNDPMMAAAAYNAGPNHPYFQDPDNNPLPDSTKQYLRDIAGYGGFAEPTEAVETDEGPLATSDDIGGTEQPPGFKEQLKEQLPGIVGAGAGAATGATLAAGKKAKQGMDLFADFMRSRVGAAPFQPSGIDIPTPGMPRAAAGMGGPTPSGAAPLSNIPSGGPDAGRMARGQTGTMPYNYAKAAGLTDIEAARALDMTKQAGGVHDLTTQRREGMQKIQQLFPTERYVENPRFGGLMTLDQGVGGGPRQSFVTQGPVRDVPPGGMTGPGAPPPEGSLRPLPPRVPVPTAPPAPSLLDEAIAKLGQIAKGGMRLLGSQPFAGALGGYGAAMSGVEAFQREKQGDRPGAILSGLGTLGALSAIPTPPTVAAGMAASAISPLSLMMLDRYRKIKAEPEPAPATPQEMYQAQQPAFTAQRP